MSNLARRNNIERSKTSPSKKTPVNAELILVDISDSMGGMISLGISKYDILCQVLAPLAKTAHVLAFNEQVTEVDANNLPGVQGTTATHLALHKATELQPIHCLVISDGEPDNSSKALEEAKFLSELCIIDTLYIGPPDLERAVEFMKELATIGRGRFQIVDLQNTIGQKQLGNSVNQLLLAPPEQESIKL
jgi:hypothetical protein